MFILLDNSKAVTANESGRAAQFIFQLVFRLNLASSFWFVPCEAGISTVWSSYWHLKLETLSLVAGPPMANDVQPATCCLLHTPANHQHLNPGRHLMLKPSHPCTAPFSPSHRKESSASPFFLAILSVTPHLCSKPCGIAATGRRLSSDCLMKVIMRGLRQVGK